MDIKQKMQKGFQQVDGGLFGTVLKADVGNVADAMGENKVDMLCWADPFMPDQSMPAWLKDVAIDYINQGGMEHYTAPIGSGKLKKAISEKLKQKNNLIVDPDRNILITPGSDSGLLMAMMPFLCPGDEVLVTDPGYPSNFLNPALLNAKTVQVPLDADNNFAIDIDKFEEKCTEKSKMVVLTSPNNPTGTVYSKEELIKLSEFVIRHDLVLIVDQAFEDLIYDDKEMVTMASLPGMWERTVTVFSVSKGLALSGIRVGYLVADDKIMNTFFGCAVNIIGATSTLSQSIAYEAFQNYSIISEYCAVYERRRHYVYRAMNAVPGVSMELPQSAFMAWINIKELGTSAEIVEYLKEHANVFVNDGAAYGESGKDYIRVIFGCYLDDKVIYNAIDRMQKAMMKKSEERGIRQ